MVDEYTLHKDALDVKHAELIAMAKSFVEWAHKYDSHSLARTISQAPKPTRSVELLLWGRFYSQNALGEAFGNAYQEYVELEDALKS
jgi:hypothetical protein